MSAPETTTVRVAHVRMRRGTSRKIFMWGRWVRIKWRGDCYPLAVKRNKHQYGR